MKIEFDIKPYQACMNVKVSYEKEEIHQDYFYLNRDFAINRCFADDAEYDITKETELVALENWGYEVNKYLLPQSFENIVIEYTGYLTGKTGSCPYVRETISSEFVFIRWETFCYPIFFNENVTLQQFLQTRLNIDVTVIMPDEFIAVSCAPETASYVENGVKIQKFFSDRNDTSVAVAKYTIKKLSIGTFYLLGEINNTELEVKMTMAHNFMNEHFGLRDINSRVNYAAIPNKFGSFATYITVFIDEVALETIKTMNHIIHEFIHLGWNVKADEETQGIRFFDEAFTSYFEMRVMEYLLKDNCRYNDQAVTGRYDLQEKIDAYKNQITGDYDRNIPIADFGKHRYGDLSYTIGAICLYKLSEFVGIDVFDEATKIFLQKYKDTPVNIETFCNEYTKLCGKPELEQFFKDWIYTTNGPKSFIESYL